MIFATVAEKNIIVIDIVTDQLHGVIIMSLKENVPSAVMNTTPVNSNKTEVYTLTARRVILRPIEQKDLSLLHKWRNDPMFISLCSARRSVIGYEEFISELRHDLERDRHIQCIIELNGKGIPIGTIYSYGLNLADGYVFITIYLPKEYQHRGFGPESVALLLKFLFDSLPLNKVYMEAYDYNQLSLSPLRNFGFREEGRFKEHRFFSGARHDLIRFAIYRADLERISALIARLTKTRKPKTISVSPVFNHNSTSL